MNNSTWIGGGISLEARQANRDIRRDVQTTRKYLSHNELGNLRDMPLAHASGSFIALDSPTIPGVSGITESVGAHKLKAHQPSH